MDSSLILTLMKVIAIPLCAIFLVGKFNLFEYIDFVPSEYSFDAGLTGYFALLELLYLKIFNYVDTYHKANIECIFYKDKPSRKLSNIPEISFSSEVVYINCYLEFRGGSKKLANSSLVITLPNWVDVQETRGSTGVVNEKNQFIIDLKKLVRIEDKKIERSTVDIKIGLIRNEAPDNHSLTIIPRIENKSINRCFVKFTSNKFELSN